MMDVNAARIIILLGNTRGPLSRWQLTQRVVSHMHGNKARRALLEQMENDGLIYSYSELKISYSKDAKKIKSRRGPAATKFELSKKGRDLFEKIKDLDAIRSD